MTEVLANYEDVLALDEEARKLLFTEARSANSFSDEPVTDEQLRAIFELTKWAPTAANTQPLRVLYVAKGEARDRLVEHMMGTNQAKTASAPAVAVLAADLSFHEHIPTVFPIRPEMKDSFEANPEGRTKHALFNATLQAGYFLLGVRAAGLAAGPMAGFDADGVDKEFFPEGRLRTILVVNIGRPGENPWFDRLPRLEYEQVVQHV
ncbi:MAG TPA: malonic semialdehyde reductase [Pseudonocardia sp.]|uniref:malonic semialdehyde reductase n=1 Tax=Pseudonocardia sp. TaxID=60912 RepID=UPI002CC925A9|nr:malonic semialdehyde reductase [Pseudonocardia sp.]HTF48592.1 malonic semialdehyde reductase [Pseudonocardia sp.]